MLRELSKFETIKDQIKVSIGQIKTVSGDLKGNTERILKSIERAISEQSDLLVLPELAITGYNCGMLFKQQQFIDYNLRFLYKTIAPKVPKDMVVVVGFVDCIGTHFDNTPNIQNSLAVIQDGYVIGKYAKILLANGGHHEDNHYFTPGQHATVTRVKLKGVAVNLGTVICEDTWNMDHDRNIVRESVQNGAELIVTINQSYFAYQKQLIRQNMYLQHASKNNVYIISCNNVGVGDISKNFMIYDGGSMIVSPQGQIIKQATRFQEDFITSYLTHSFERNPIMDKQEEIFRALVYAQREIFKDLGISKAQVHMSGGIDSSVVLPILVEAMGKENIIAISNPSKYNGVVTKNNAQYICDKLGVKLYWNEIGTIEYALEKSHIEAFGKDSIKPLVLSTFDAVGRTVQGLAAAHTFGSAIVATGNHTEIVLGWANFHDIGSVGVMSLIGDLTKVEIFQLAKYINEKIYNDEIIPKNLYDGSTDPAAELADANKDPWDYYVVSGICALLIRRMKSIEEILDMFINHSLPSDYFPKNPFGHDVYNLVDFEEFKKNVIICFNRCKANVFKSAQAAPVVMISPISRGFSTREVIINKYEGRYDDSVFENNKIKFEMS
jgi:NAD+ synthase (glutamine-hydrolysing)